MESVTRGESLVQNLAGLCPEVADDMAPIPMFAADKVTDAGGAPGFTAFATRSVSPDVPSNTVVVSCEVATAKLNELRQKEGIKVWANSRLEYWLQKRHQRPLIISLT